MDFSLKNLLSDFKPRNDRSFGDALQSMRDHRLKMAVPEMAATVSRFKSDALKSNIEYSVLKKSFFLGYHAAKEAVQAVSAQRSMNDASCSYMEDALEDIRHGLNGLKKGVKTATDQNHTVAEISFWRIASARLDALNKHLQGFHEKARQSVSDKNSRPSPA